MYAEVKVVCSKQSCNAHVENNR